MKLMIALNGGMLKGFLRYLPQIARCCKSLMRTKKPISPTGEWRAEPMIVAAFQRSEMAQGIIAVMVTWLLMKLRLKIVISLISKVVGTLTSMSVTSLSVVSVSTSCIKVLFLTSLLSIGIMVIGSLLIMLSTKLINAITI